MKMNPLHLEPGTVFICGKATDMEVSGYVEFEKFEELLKAKGIKYISQQRIFESLDANKTFTIAEMVKRCASYMAMCDKVVTLQEWNTCFHAKSLIEMARALTKKIYPAERFFDAIKSEQQNATS